MTTTGAGPRVDDEYLGRQAPTLALIVPGVIGFLLMMVSHIVLRQREPDTPRPYRTLGGTAEEALT